MSKATLIALFAVFLAPVLIAVGLNSQWVDWRPGGTQNYGKLIEPPVRLPEFNLSTADGEALSRDVLAGQWQLLHYRPVGCDAACLEALYWMRQVRRAQDRHQPDVALMLVTPARIDADTLAEVQELAADYRVVSAQAGAVLSQWLPHDGEGVISYIIDPRGHIILSYPSEADFNGMRRDLSRLLSWTHNASE